VPPPPPPPPGSLTIFALGHFPSSAIQSLFQYFSRLELMELPIGPRATVEDHKSELNRAIAAAASDWILILREREMVDAALAAEIDRVSSDAKAWGFRIRSIPFYAGRPLKIGLGEGEIRLFHRRHYTRFEGRREARAIRVQGTVIRLANALRSETFASSRDHWEYLARTAVPHSRLRTVLLFARNAIASWAFDANTLRYLWIEASFDAS
jgi:hypothetical protein